LELVDQTESIRTASPGHEDLARFGATVTSTSWGLVVAGGIIPRRIVPFDREILLLNSEELLKCIESGSSINVPILSTIGLGSDFGGPRPLLVGHASSAVTPNQVLLLGGGAVCFPFGTVWTEGTWTLSSADSPVENDWTLVREDAQPAKATADKPAKNKLKTFKSTTNVASIPRVQIQTAIQFQQVLADGKPVVIERSDIGPCTERWTKEYLVNAVGSERAVRNPNASSRNTHRTVINEFY
jgi:tRNA wybutosine-synthesizing protein 4